MKSKQPSHFFNEVCSRYDTEAMLQLFWDNDGQEYFLYCPIQTVSHAVISIERNYQLERESWLIMDLHSHGRISCSFSSIDDEDEQETRYYGVFYGYGSNHMPAFDLRAGCCGRYFSVPAGDIFEMQEAEFQDYNFDEWYSNITFR